MWLCIEYLTTITGDKTYFIKKRFIWKVLCQHLLNKVVSYDDILNMSGGNNVSSISIVNDHMHCYN